MLSQHCCTHVIHTGSPVATAGAVSWVTVPYKRRLSLSLLRSFPPKIHIRTFSSELQWIGHVYSVPYCTRPRNFHNSFTNPYLMPAALSSGFEITSTWLPIPFANSTLLTSMLTAYLTPNTCLSTLKLIYLVPKINMHS